MGKLFVRERHQAGTGSEQPRFRVVAALETDLRVFVPHLRRAELEQLASAAGAEVVYLARGEYAGAAEHGRGEGRRDRRGMHAED